MGDRRSVYYDILFIEQLKVIFIHELSHFRQRDLWLKRAAALLLAVQWINPAVWIFQRLVVLWSEYSCDQLSYSMCGGKKAYFCIVAEMAMNQAETQNRSASTLFADVGELERRIKHMRWCGKRRQGTIWVSALLMTAMVLTEAGTAFAAVQTAGFKVL